jgi:hypothetical protein
VIIIHRAGIWKPQVTPLAEPVQAPTGESLLTKTSLALHHEVNIFNFSKTNCKLAMQIFEFFWRDF